MCPETIKGGALPGVCAAAVAILGIGIPALTTLAAQEKPAQPEDFPAYFVILTPSGTQDLDTGAAPRVYSAVMMPVDDKRAKEMNVDAAAALVALVMQQKP